MKKVLLSLVLIASVSLAFGQDYSVKDYSSLLKKVDVKAPYSVQGVFDQNLDFEGWFSDYDAMGFGKMPDGWFMLTGNPDAQRSSNAQSGSFSMHVESNVANNPMLGWSDTLVGGVAFIGHVEGMGSIIQTEPYVKRPTSVSFYLRGNLLGNDTAVVSLQLIKDGSLAGGVTKFFGAGEISEEWKQFTLDITYDTEDAPTQISMMVSSTGVGVFQGQNFGTLTEGSYVEFDNMSFGTSTDITETKSFNLELYPNPANQNITISNAMNSEVSIFNMVGQSLMSVNIQQNRQTIDVSELPKGTFIIQIKKGNQIHTQKLNIVR